MQDPEHHDGARDTRWRDDRMTGRRSYGRLSALNGVVHQGTSRRPRVRRARPPRTESPGARQSPDSAAVDGPATPWSRPVPPAARWDVALRLSVSSVIHDRPSTPRSSFWTVRVHSVCRRGRWKMSRSVSAVSMARSEYCRCPPRVPTPTASQVAIASGANHTVISPRWTSARSYVDQFPTWYFVLYFGCTLDFMSRSCACRRYNGQDVERGSPRARDPCTNAATWVDPLILETDKVNKRVGH